MQYVLGFGFPTKCLLWRPSPDPETDVGASGTGNGASSGGLNGPIEPGGRGGVAHTVDTPEVSRIADDAENLVVAYPLGRTCSSCFQDELGKMIGCARKDMPIVECAHRPC